MEENDVSEELIFDEIDTNFVDRVPVELSNMEENIVKMDPDSTSALSSPKKKKTDENKKNDIIYSNDVLKRINNQPKRFRKKSKKNKQTSIKSMNSNYRLQTDMKTGLLDISRAKNNNFNHRRSSNVEKNNYIDTKDLRYCYYNPIVNQNYCNNETRIIDPPNSYFQSSFHGIRSSHEDQINSNHYFSEPYQPMCTNDSILPPTNYNNLKVPVSYNDFNSVDNNEINNYNRSGQPTNYVALQNNMVDNYWDEFLNVIETQNFEDLRFFLNQQHSSGYKLHDGMFQTIMNSSFVPIDFKISLFQTFDKSRLDKCFLSSLICNLNNQQIKCLKTNQLIMKVFEFGSTLNIDFGDEVISIIFEICGKNKFYEYITDVVEFFTKKRFSVNLIEAALTNCWKHFDSMIKIINILICVYSVEERHFVMSYTLWGNLAEQIMNNTIKDGINYGYFLVQMFHINTIKISTRFLNYLFKDPRDMLEDRSLLEKIFSKHSVNLQEFIKLGDNGNFSKVVSTHFHICCLSQDINKPLKFFPLIKKVDKKLIKRLVYEHWLKKLQQQKGRDSLVVEVEDYYNEYNRNL